MPPLAIERTADGVVLDVKVVPNARADAVVGPLGDALKVKVATPAEAGNANAAVCRLLADAVAVDRHSVRLVAGESHPRKRIAIAGLDAAAVRAKLKT